MAKVLKEEAIDLGKVVHGSASQSYIKDGKKVTRTTYAWRDSNGVAHVNSKGVLITLSDDTQVFAAQEFVDAPVNTNS